LRFPKPNRKPRRALIWIDNVNFKISSSNIFQKNL
jgi:hypothetical protein